MSPLALAVVAGLFGTLQALTLFILAGLREDIRDMRRELAHLRGQVAGHESFIAALKIAQRTEA